MDRLIAVVTFVIAFVATVFVSALFNLEAGIAWLLVALVVASTATWVVTRRRKIARH
jgi:ABC-type xylose transport system permease subunit